MRQINLDLQPGAENADACPLATAQLDDLLQLVPLPGDVPLAGGGAAVERTLRSLLELNDRDRRRIALEIHDGFEQLLTAAIMHFDTFKALGQGNPVAEENMERGLRLLAVSMRRARRLVNQLQPPSLDDMGLAAAVADLVREARLGDSGGIELSEEGGLDCLPPRLQSAVFRIVQEGLANACQHSRSEKIRIELRRHGHSLRVAIQDWGVGFDPQCVPPESLGLESIRARALAFGGQLTLDSRPGCGTLVAVELPVPEAEPLASVG